MIVPEASSFVFRPPQAAVVWQLSPFFDGGGMSGDRKAGSALSGRCPLGLMSGKSSLRNSIYGRAIGVVFCVHCQFPFSRTQHSGQMVENSGPHGRKLDLGQVSAVLGASAVHFVAAAAILLR